MCFSRWLKMTEIRNLHNKTRLLYYRNSPPFHFIAIDLIKTCHKSSKFQNSWKIGEKIYQIFFFKINFLVKTFHFETILTYFKKKKKIQKFYVMIKFLKNSNSNFLKNFYYSQKNEWHRWTLGTIMKVKNTIWEISYQWGSNFSAKSWDPTLVKFEHLLKIFTGLIAIKWNGGRFW